MWVKFFFTKGEKKNKQTKKNTIDKDGCYNVCPFLHLTVTSLCWAFQEVNAPVVPPAACLHRLDTGL